MHLRATLARTGIFVAICSAHCVLAVSPSDVVLTIPYGTERGMLDTSRVDSDDPFRSLVAAYQVAGATTYVLPMRGVLQDSLLYYEAGAFTGTLPVPGSSDFLVLDDGTIYAVVFGMRTNNYAYISRRFPTGVTETVVLPRTAVDSNSYRDRLQLLNGSVFLVNPIRAGHAVALGAPGQFKSALTAADVRTRIPTSAGDTWQNTLLIMRGDQPLLDLGLRGGGLVWVFPDGGFVIDRGTVPDVVEGTPRLFQYYDAAGALQHEFTTQGSLQYYNSSRPYVFTEDHVYQLVLAADEAQLLRYRGGE